MGEDVTRPRRAGGAPMERCRDASGLSQPQTRALKALVGGEGFAGLTGGGRQVPWRDRERRAVPRLSDSVEIARPSEDVWRFACCSRAVVRAVSRDAFALRPLPRGGRATTTSRTRANEDVRVTVTRCEPPGVLEEHEEGRIFSRDVVHSLTPSALGTSVRVDDEVIFKGNGRWRRRWPRVTSGSGARPR